MYVSIFSLHYYQPQQKAHTHLPHFHQEQPRSSSPITVSPSTVPYVELSRVWSKQQPDSG